MAEKAKIRRGAKRSVSFKNGTITSLRKKENITVEELAEAANVDPKTVQRAQNGTSISWDKAQQIKQVLKIKDDQFLKIINSDSSEFSVTINPQKPTKNHFSDDFFDRRIGLPKIQTSDDSRFLYNSNRLEFIGRESALSELQEFCNRPEPFLWWNIVGSGGVGKTRLAFQFCRILEEEGLWNAGFLYKTNDQQKTDEKDLKESLLTWESCQPTKPTLVIVDHIADRAHFIGNLVYILAKRAERIPLLNPVRMLIIEREADGIWKDDFSKRQDRVIRSFQDTSRHTGFPLDLMSLDDDSLCRIIEKMSETDIKGHPHLLEQLESVDSKKRPLFAALIGDAIKRTGSPRRWDQEALLSDVLEHNQKEHWTPAGVTDADKVWLCLATLSGGASSSWLEDSRLTSVLKLPTIDDRMLIHRYSIMIGQRPQSNAGVTEFGPLRPDILGEFFVLKFLSDGNNLTWLKLLSLCLNIAWEKNPSYVAEFLGCLERDFFDYKEAKENTNLLPHFFSPPACKDTKVLLFWGILMLKRAGWFGRHNNNPERAIDIYDQILDQLGGLSRPVFDELFSKALCSKMASLLKLGRYEDIIAVYNIFKPHSDAAFEPYVSKKESAGLALFLKASALGHIGSNEEVLVICDAVLSNFDIDAEAISDDLRADFDTSFKFRIRPLVCGAILLKAFHLCKLGRIGQAKSLMEDNKYTLAEMPNNSVVAQMNTEIENQLVGQSEGYVA